MSEPAAFVDAAGARWPVRVTVADVRRVKAELGFDLLTLFDDDGGAIAKLAQDPLLVADVGFCLMRPEAARRNVDADAFAALIGGDGLGALFDAILEGTADFFPEPRRTAWKAAITKFRALETEAMAKATTMIDAVQLPPLPGNLSGNSPASPASTRTRGRSPSLP